MKLKTLKTIKIRRPQGVELAYLDWYKEQLKKEAIRHAKSMMKHIDITVDDILNEKVIPISPLSQAYIPRIEWIIYFFNLKKGDLK